MRKIIQLTLFLVIATNVFCQKKFEKEGDFHLEHFQYVEAAKKYQEGFDENQNDYGLAYKLAQAYLSYYNYGQAEKYFGIVAEHAVDKYPMSMYWHAETMKIRGEYAQAKEEFEYLLGSAVLGMLDKGYAEKAQLELEGCQMAIIELKKPTRDYKFQDIEGELNSSGQDYKVAFFEHDTSVVITSDRVQSESYSNNDQFRFVKTEEGIWEENKGKDDFYSVVNSKYNDAAGCFTNDKKTYYFTRCDGKSKFDKMNEYNCLIYETKLVDGKWTKAERLNENINPEGVKTTNPSLSPTGDTLFFVSDRSGGKGMNDIWYSIKSSGGDWGNAINLENVNTPFTDVSPFMDPDDGNLYFASNGRESFGGLDIYIAIGEGFDSVRNMGLPFNSHLDDFYFVVGDSLGYLTSNREGGKGGDDIYAFTRRSEKAVLVEVSQDSLEKEGAATVTISGEIYDAQTLVPKEDVQETLYDETGTAIKTTKSNQEGKFKFENLPANHSYTVVVEDVDANIAHTSEVIVENVEVKTSKEEATEFQFENIYFDTDKSTIRPEAKKVLESLVQYYKDNPDIQIEINANTDAIGAVDYNQKLSQKRGYSAYRFLTDNGVDKAAIVINALGESNELASNESQIGRQLNRRVEFKIIGGGTYSPEAMVHVVDRTTSLDQLAKKFGMSVEELKELNDLDSDEVEAFKPLRIRNTGDDELIEPLTMANANKKPKYNKKYYKKKAKRLAAYKTEYDELNATYENYEKVKKELKITESQDYYVARKKNTLWRIAKLYGMSVEQLKDINGITSDTIYVNQPLIVIITDAPVQDNQYRVKEGDELDQIAEDNNISKKDLVKWNEFKGYTLRPGMILFIQEPPVPSETEE